MLEFHFFIDSPSTSSSAGAKKRKGDSLSTGDWKGISIQTRNNVLFISHIDKLKPLVLVPFFLTPLLSFQIM